MSRPTLEELGITDDTIIIEVSYEELDEDQEEQRLEDMLNAIREGK